MNFAKVKKHLEQYPVVPVIIPSVTFKTSKEAVAIAQALAEGGIPQVEILVRGDRPEWEIAIKAIEAIGRECKEDIMICAGTVNEPEKMQMAVEAGADFLVSADSREDVLNYWQSNYPDMAFYPGGSTPTELATILRKMPGAKLFPANQLPHLDDHLASLRSVYSHVDGVHLVLSYDKTHPDNIRDLKNPIVAGIAAAWVVPPVAVAEKKWDEISRIAELTQRAVAFSRNSSTYALDQTIKKICQAARVEPTGINSAANEESPHKYGLTYYQRNLLMSEIREKTQKLQANEGIIPMNSPRRMGNNQA